MGISRSIVRVVRRGVNRDRCAVRNWEGMRQASLRRPRRLARPHDRAGAVSHRLGDNTNDDLSLPGTNSQQATTSSTNFPDQLTARARSSSHAPSGKLTDSNYSKRGQPGRSRCVEGPDVASVDDPLTPQGASAMNKDQPTAYISVTLTVRPGSLSQQRRPGDRQCRRARQGRWSGRRTGGQVGQGYHRRPNRASYSGSSPRW